MVAAVVSVSFATLFLNVGGDVLSTMGRNPTLTGRTYIWDALLTIPTNPILGTGFESFWLGERLKILWSVPILEGINEAHNGYLELYLNLGWIGLILFAGIMIAGYRNVLRLLDKDPEAGRLRLGFFVIAVIYDFTEAAIRTSDLVWIGFLFAVFTLPKIAHEEEPEVTAKTVTPALVAERGRLRTLNPGRSRQTTIHSLGT
jgi:O-antigen ligase